MLQPGDTDGITVAARDEVQDEANNLMSVQQSFQARLGSTDQDVVALQACIDNLNALIADISQWQVA